MIDSGEALKAVEYIGASNRKLAKLASEMAAACYFFASDNVDIIREWGRHRIQPTPFDVTYQSGNDGITVVFHRSATKEDEREYARLFLPTALAEWADKDEERIVVEALQQSEVTRLSAR